MDYIKEVDVILPSLFGRSRAAEVLLGDSRPLLELLVGGEYIRSIIFAVVGRPQKKIALLNSLVFGDNTVLPINQMDDRYLLNEFLIIYADDYDSNLQIWLDTIDPGVDHSKLIESFYKVVKEL